MNEYSESHDGPAAAKKAPLPKIWQKLGLVYVGHGALYVQLDYTCANNADPNRSIRSEHF